MSLHKAPLAHQLEFVANEVIVNKKLEAIVNQKKQTVSENYLPMNRFEKLLGGRRDKRC